MSDSNTCSGVRLLGMVGLARSSIVPVVASRAEDSGKRCGGVRKPSALTSVYQGDNL